MEISRGCLCEYLRVWIRHFSLFFFPFLRSILEQNGSAVDAALASLICNGLVNMQSLGFGGGFMMTIYERATRQAFVLNARDRAPLSANSTMYDGKPANTSSFGKYPGDSLQSYRMSAKFQSPDVRR